MKWFYVLFFCILSFEYAKAGNDLGGTGNKLNFVNFDTGEVLSVVSDEYYLQNVNVLSVNESLFVNNSEILAVSLDEFNQLLDLPERVTISFHQFGIEGEWLYTQPLVLPIK